MKKNLRIVPSNFYNVFQQKPLRFLFTILLVLVFGVTTKTQAQCIGPYQYFDSFRAAANRALMISTEGWTLSAASVGPINFASNARTGINLLSVGTSVGNNAITPLLVDPQTFTFYIKDVSTLQNAGVEIGVNYRVDCCANTTFASGVTTLKTGTTLAGSVYDFVSIDLSAYSNIYVRIYLVSQTTATLTPLYVDDLGWTSRTASNNTKVIPEPGASCTSGSPILVPSACNGSYSFYDQGATNDNYNKSQTQILYFAPTTVGEKVKFTFNSFAIDALSPATSITVYNGNGTIGGTEFAGLNLATSVSAGTTATSTHISGYITVKFVTTTSASALVAANAGFDITVQSVGVPTISNLLTPTSGCQGVPFVITGANLTGASSVTVGGVLATIGANTCNSLTITPAAGSSGTVVVTASSGTANSTSTYTVNALPTISSPPSSGTQTLCLNGSATALSVSATAGSGSISKYEWYSNTSASTVGAVLVLTTTTAATSDTYTPLTTSLGTLFYYVVVTNSNGCAVTSSFTGAITVNAPVVITVHPSTSIQSVCVGGSITSLSVTATGGGLSYQWYSNLSNSNSGGTLIGGATASSYTPSNASAAITYYYCVVSNGAPCNSSATSAVSGSITVNATPTTVTVSTPGIYCTSTTLTAANVSSGTIYYQGTTTGGTSTATPSASQLVSVSGTYYFRAQSGAGCWGTEGSATVTINTVPTAPAPSAGSGATTSSITANWVVSSGATGYYLDVATDNAFTSMVSGYNNFSVGNVLTYNVTGLASGTTYYYRVRAANACGSSTTFGVTTYATLSLAYCTPNVPTTTTSFVNNFSTSGGITNISNLGTGFTTGGYANYSAQSCSQYPSSSVGYSITSVRTDSSDQTFFYYIWIDWNNDGDFLDAGETMLATTTFQGGPFIGSFAVPAAQAAGSYRMRISTSWFGTNTSCAISNRSETEDYTITVVPVPPCAASTPSALTSSSIFATGATISWTDAAMTPNSIYNYYWNTTGIAPLVGTTPTGTVTGANSANLTLLTLGTTYYFWVRSNCGTPSAWVGSSNFTTVNVDIINMANGSIITCNARFFDSGGSVGNYANSETFTYTITPSGGSKLKVVFNSFSTETNWDGLLIYNGNSTAAPLIPSALGVGSNATTAPAGSYRGTGSPGTIYSTAADGSLTFKFTSDGSQVFSGWDANVTCVTVPAITSFTPTSTCSGTTPVVTLTGVNFTGATSVLFNGVSAAYTIVSDTSITTTVPVSATSGYISVTNAQATGLSTTIFSVNPTPATPNAGSNVAICNGGSTTLTGTSSGVVNTVLSENFNAGTWPTGWSRTLNGGFSPGDFRTSSEFVSGGNTWAGNGYTGFCSYFYSYSIPGGTSGDMITPAMDLSFYTSSSMTFWIYNSLGTDALNVYANNNGGAYALLGTYATYGSWTQITVNLNAYVGAGFTAVRLKFTGTSDGGSSNIGVDDIAVTGTITATYLWSPSTGLSATNLLTPVASPTSTTAYTLTTSFPSGCSASSTPVTVTVNARPTVTITTSPASVCGNSVIPVNVTGTATTYTWTSTVANTLYSDSTGTTLYVAGTNTTVVYVKTPSTATITATGTNAATCTDTSSVVFTVATKTFSGGLWSPAGDPPATGGTDNLEFNSAWSAGSGVLGLSGCSCTVNAGASVFNSGQTLTLTNGLTVAGGSLTFNNGASLVQTNNVANTGTITYMRNTTPIYKFDYTYWSTPVSPQTLFNVSPLSPLFYQYDSSIPNWVYVSSGTTMIPAKGYIIRAPSTWPLGPVAPPPVIYTASFIGVPNNGTYTIPIVGGANQLNLLGNPYPSALSATLFVNDPSNVSVVGGTLYFWTHNTPINASYQYTGSDYASFNTLGGVGTAATNPGLNMSVPNGKIASGQGFFIKGLANGNATFSNSMRIAGNNDQFYKTNNPVTSSETEVEKHRFWLDISNTEGAYKQMLLGYVAGGTIGLDRAYDGEMVDIGTVVTLYTTVETKKLSIEGRGLPFDVTDTVPLGYKSTINSTYSIALSDFDGLFDHQAVYLEDNVTGEIHDLKNNPYTFATTIGTFENRFVLRFTTNALGVITFDSNSVVVYNNDLGLHIATGNVLMKNVKLFDITGRLITSRDNINDSETLFTNLPTTQQVLLVQITSETGVTVTKKVVF